MTAISKAQRRLLRDLRFTDVLRPTFVGLKYRRTLRALNERGLILMREVKLGPHTEHWWCITEKGLNALAQASALGREGE